VCFEHLNFGHSDLFRISDFDIRIYYCFPFTFLLAFTAGGRKGTPPIIEPTCAFDAKIYKNVDAIYAVSPCLIWNKKIFKLFYFYFQLPSLLVENSAHILPILTAKNTRINRRFHGLR